MRDKIINELPYRHQYDFCVPSVTGKDVSNDNITDLVISKLFVNNLSTYGISVHLLIYLQKKSN